MKRVFIIGVISLLSCTLSAQSYRGFVDVVIGYPVASGKSLGGSLDSGERNYMWYGGVLTSHGCQIKPNIYVGGGTGLLAQYSDRGGFQMPFFADARYDFWGNRGVGFYAGLRLGYSISIKSGEAYDYGESAGHSCGNASWLYFQPTVGMRVKLGSRTGLNIGVSYIPVKVKPVDYRYGDYSEEMASKDGKTVVSNITLSVGVDF